MNFVFYVLCLFLTITANKISDKYISDREKLLKQEDSCSVGGQIKLSEKETRANDILMKLKRDELQKMFLNPTSFYMSSHFLLYKDRMRQSKVYDIIKNMPKGALLHLHLFGSLNSKYLLNMTYVFSDFLYVCQEKGDFSLKFSRSIPKVLCDTSWKGINYVRKKTKNFDEKLLQSFSLTVNDNIIGGDINSIWQTFENKFKHSKYLTTFKPILEKYFYQLLKACHDDNIMYIELRSSLKTMYDLNQEYSPEDTIQCLVNIAAKFKKEYPDFIGFKLIISIRRNLDENTLKNSIKMAIRFKEEFPDLIAGFDIIGQEDKGHTLFDYRKELIKYKDKINYFFHAGETNWNGLYTDENLIDAILLGTKRIGHGFALAKHSSVLKLIKEKNIAVEMNVISNSILSHVKDIRNHPLSYYLALGLPVVISSDDPGLWGAEMLTDDFFVTFMGIASAKADLHLLKQLVLNSIEYSSMDSETKKEANGLLEIKWNNFIKYIIKCHG